MENFSNLMNLMKQAKKMKTVFKAIQEELATVRVTGKAGVPEEEVKIEMNGHSKVLNCSIDPSLLTLDKKVLEELIAAATNDAFAKAKDAQHEKMGSGFGLPFNNMDMSFMSEEEEP